MLASEYVEKLNELIEKYGDGECVDSNDEQIGNPEVIEGLFVLAEEA